MEPIKPGNKTQYNRRGIDLEPNARPKTRRYTYHPCARQQPPTNYFKLVHGHKLVAVFGFDAQSELSALTAYGQAVRMADRVIAAYPQKSPHLNPKIVPWAPFYASDWRRFARMQRTWHDD